MPSSPARHCLLRLPDLSCTRHERRGYRLSAEQLCALEVLADAGLWGCTSGTLFTYGFRVDVLTNLVRDGFATARREMLTIGNRKIRAPRVWITEAGQTALENAIQG
jgi:hypothetical protein